MVLLAVLSYGSYRLAAPKQEGSLRIALVQANRIVQDRMPMGEQQAHLEAYEALTREASGMVPDLIVWPASSLPSPMIKGGYVFRRVTQLAKETGCRLLVGGAGYEKMKALHERRATYANNELLVTPSGAIEAQYNKIKLVPFNEEIPLEGKVPWPQWVTPLKQSFTAGSSFTLFSVGEARFGTPICWENYFPDFFRKFMASGANLMVSVTNDSFFGPTEGQYQTLAMNVFRAVENRVTVVRSTPTGVSAFIGPDGQIVERVRDSTGKDLFVAGCLVREIPLNNRKTFYTMHGDAFAGSVSLIAAVGVMAAFRVSFRVRPPLRGTAGAELRSE
jgi:apolipoprotein N-acyltransferase